MQLENTLQNVKSVQEVSKVSRLGRFERAGQSASRNRDKTHADYWKQRLFRNSYCQNGAVIECGNFAVKIQQRGRCETFAPKSGNREMAAREAKEIYTYALANGMTATVAKFKPDMAERIASPTLGEFLAEIKAKAGFRPKTFKCYAHAFRKITADIFKIDGGKARFDYKKGGRAEWVKRVEAIKLDTLTPDKIQAWKIACLERTGINPVQLTRTKRNVNSFIRQARSLFGRKATAFLANIHLPNPPPFAGIAFEKRSEEAALVAQCAPQSP